MTNPAPNAPAARGTPDAAMTVYVHLAHGYDARDWRRRWETGALVGVNEPVPYGYHHAAEAGCALRFSRDAAEGRVGRCLRGGLRLLLGFDLVHAWRNRRELDGADVVWTHTESQHLGIAALMKLRPRARRPALVASNVWLMDRWGRLDPLRRALYRWLIREAGVLTFHSPLNRAAAAARFPGTPCALVRFGICADRRVAPAVEARQGPLRLLALGNDRHRDWALLLDAFGGREGYELRIASAALSPAAVKRFGNVTVLRPAHNDELAALFRWADAVVLPLRPNLHASGSTVLQEAVLAGRPVVCSRAGGLDSYFGDDEVGFVPPGDAAALRAGVDAVRREPAAALRRARAAQVRMGGDGLGSRAFVAAHVALSRALVRAAGSGAAAAPDEASEAA